MEQYSTRIIAELLDKVRGIPDCDVPDGLRAIEEVMDRIEHTVDGINDQFDKSMDAINEKLDLIMKALKIEY